MSKFLLGYPTLHPAIPQPITQIFLLIQMNLKTTTPEEDCKVEMADLETPMFMTDCTNCDFCSGLREEDVKEDRTSGLSATGEIIRLF